MKQHYVEPNQTVAIVAEKYSISIGELLGANPELQDQHIHTGMLLNIPATAAPTHRFSEDECRFINAYNSLAAVVHIDNAKKGFWPKGGRVGGLPAAAEGERNVGEMLMLAVTELSEALEAHRKNLMDDKLPHHKGMTVEIADAIIRLMDTGYGLGLPVAEAVIEKLAYNRTRPYKHGKAY
jgi:hypothetical protein